MTADSSATRLGRERPAPRPADVAFVHRFDTDRRDLQWRGCLLELHERAGRFLLVAAASAPGFADEARRAEAQIDASWAMSILAGGKSPLEALAQRLGPGPSLLLEQLRAATSGRTLRRADSRVAGAPDQAPHRVEAFPA